MMVWLLGQRPLSSGGVTSQQYRRAL
jgi:hypothetical protein